MNKGKLMLTIWTMVPKLQCRVAVAMKVFLCASWSGAATKVKLLCVMFNLSCMAGI